MPAPDKADTTRPLHKAEIAAFEALAEVRLAERDLFSAQAQKAGNDAMISAINLRTKQREEAAEQANNSNNFVYVFDKQVDDNTVKSCITKLTEWSRLNPECEIEVQINSPGGSIFAGLALVDFIRSLQDKGHTVNTVALGVAASMGGVILQVGTTRIMGKNCILLLHQGSLGAIGDFAQVEDRVRLMSLFHERILDIFEERSKPINPKTTKAFIKRNWDRKDWWMTADDALKLGFVDEVR
jgi:ATP-dependent Clp endopeptidase proteolytic subunit ClpP